MSVRITGETRREVHHLRERLSGREFQGLDNSEVSDRVNMQLSMMGIEVAEHNDICK